MGFCTNLFLEITGDEKLTSQLKDQRDEYDIKFLKNLEKMSNQDRSILKRGAGLPINESNKRLLVFYRMLKGISLYPNEEEIYYLIATLYAWNSISFNGDFGKSMALLSQKKSSTQSIENRFMVLVDCSIDSSVFSRYMLNLVKITEKNSIGIDWDRLLKDLKYWEHEDGFIQKKWIKSFFS